MAIQEIQSVLGEENTGGLRRVAVLILDSGYRR
jgi:hypothetical protein